MMAPRTNRRKLKRTISLPARPSYYNLAIAKNCWKENNMPTGSVISYKEDRGYGFIRPKDGGDNVYVHISALQVAGIEKLTPGQRLTYELLTQDGKTSAVNIKLLS